MVFSKEKALEVIRMDEVTQEIMYTEKGKKGVYPEGIKKKEAITRRLRRVDEVI